jgi:uncharacterized membrane protein
MKKIVYSFLLLLLYLPAFSQATDVEMADAMRANGKIYVVVGIILIILIGFVAYLTTLDRKLTRLEKESKK